MTIRYQTTSAVTAAVLSIALSLASCGGSGGGDGILPPIIQPQGPTVTGLTRFEDRDRDGAVSAGDALIVSFSADVALDNATDDDFAMPVVQDSLGAGASVEGGPAANEVTIRLGSGAVLRTRGRFANATTTANSPSGIDVTVAQKSIVAATDGTAATATLGSDIAPAPVAATTLPTTDVLDVAVGDTDGDGTRDLVSVTANELRIAKGAGAFGFASPVVFAAQGLRGVAVADLNRFSADEVVTIHATFTQIWNNNGSISQGEQLQSGDTRDLAIADFDGNGKPDIATASADGVRIFPHLGSLGNSFGAPTLLPLSQAQAIVAVDVDGDGDVDLLVGRGSGQDGQVLRNDGTGTFVDAGSLGVTDIEDLSVGDVDGDGDMDAVAARDTLSTLGLTNDGQGAFTASQIAAPARHAALVDLDGDARADLVLADGSAASVWMNDRSGGFTRSKNAADLAGTTALVATDLDADADADLVIAHAAGIDLLAGSLAGTQGTATLASAAALGAETSNALALGDIDGDGDLDKVVANLGINQVFLNDGEGGFAFSGQPGHILGSGDSRAVVLGDLDGDGDLDAVIGNTSAANGASNEIYANDGTGRFQLTQTFAPTSKTLSLVLTYFDTDRRLDIVVGNDGENQVFQNESTNGVIAFVEQTGRFSSSGNPKLDQETIALIAFDLDTDGDEDLIVVNHGTELAPQDTQVFRKSSGLFTLRHLLNVQQLAWSATMGDFDGDGIADLAMGHQSPGGSHTVRLFRGYRTTLHTLPISVDTGSEVEPHGLALRDIDGDGIADLVIANHGTPSEVLVGDGTGKFTSVQLLETDDVTAMVVADIDTDGDLDVLTTVGNSTANRVYRNQ